MTIPDSIQSVLYTPEQLQSRVSELGEQISRDYEGRDLVMIGVLKGSCMFLCDLIRAVPMNVEMDFIAVSSYGSGRSSSGSVRIVKDLQCDIEGRHVLIVEDILDSGETLVFLRDHIFESRMPASFKICTLFDKPARRTHPIGANYTGFCIPNEFIVGYGLDHAERFRNLPYVGILKPEIYR